MFFIENMMLFEHYLILTLATLPFFYKFSFWLYTIQLKEYRWDRFKEYIFTPQWKSAAINMWTVLEFPLLLLSIIVFIDRPFEIIMYNILLYFLLIQNLFILRKIKQKTLLLPKLTWRMKLTIALLLVWLSIDIWYIVYYELGFWVHTYILSILLFSPIVIFFIILLTLPLVNHLKNKKIKNAIEKSKQINSPIKVWITWSYGKSSVKEFIASILEQEWKTLKTPENINSELWVADIVLNKLKDSYKYFVVEMWAYRVWEINTLWNIANHKYWFLTAVWNQHIWLFWTQENIKKAKSEIANKVLENNWTLYVNWNNDNIRTIKFNKELNIVKYWKHSKADAKYNILSNKNWKTEFEFEYKKTKTKITIDLIGEHNIINLTWVIAFCYDLWFKTTEIKQYLKNLKTPQNTLHIEKREKYTIIDDTYNLSENWLQAWIEVLNSYKWNKILVMDDILELWKDSEKIHYNIWKSIAKNNQVNQVLFVWVNYKKYLEKWLTQGKFKKENILQNLNNVTENSTILFEWKKAFNYINKLK